MPEKNLLPFMIGTLAAGVKPAGMKMNMNRIIEALIIAGVTGSISLYGVIKVIETKMDAMEKRFSQVELQEQSSRDAMCRDIRDLRVFLQEHVSDHNKGRK